MQGLNARNSRRALPGVLGLPSVLGVLALACLATEAAAADDAALITEGRQIIEKNCARCHATGLDGGSAHPGNLRIDNRSNAQVETEADSLGCAGARRSLHERPGDRRG